MRTLATVLVMLCLPTAAIAAPPPPDGDRFQVSDATADNAIGGRNDQNSAGNPQVAAGHGEALVVWEDHRPFLPGHGTRKIYGQLVAPDGDPIGRDFRISVDGRPTKSPAVAFDSIQNRYLVAWEGERSSNQYEIYGQVVLPGGGPDGSGRPTATEDMRLSNATDAVSSTDAFDPDVGFNPGSAEFLVVWGDYRLGPTEIWGQRIGTGGAPAGDDLRLTRAGDSGPDFDASTPQIVSNGYAGIDEWGLFWMDSRDGRRATVLGTGPLYEIYARRMSADLSVMGAEIRLDPPLPEDELPPIANALNSIRSLDVAADSEHGAYLAVLATRYDDGNGKLVVPNIDGILLYGDNQVFRTNISDVQNAPSRNFGFMGADHPSVVYAPVADEYLVTYGSPQADPDFHEHETLELDRFEVFGQRVGYTLRNDDPCPPGRFEKPCEHSITAELDDDFRISYLSDMEPDRDAYKPAVSYFPEFNRYLATFDGTGVPEPQVVNGTTFNDTSDWLEVFGQRLVGPDPKNAPPGGTGPGDGGSGGGGAPAPGGGGGGLPQDAAGDPIGPLGELLASATGVDVPVRCPAAQLSATCDGQLSAQTLKAFASARKRKLELGPVAFSVPRGTTRAVRLKLGKAARRALAKSGTLKLRLTVARRGFAAVNRTVTLYRTAVLEVSPKGVLTVRAPAGRVALRIGKRVAASGRSSAGPGRLAKVRLELGKADRKAIARGRRLRATLVVSTGSLAVRLQRR